MQGPNRPRLLVLASTYPRWRGDPEPAFVHELASRLSLEFDTTVLCPHAPGAKVEEDLDGVRVRRYRYALERFETLVNDGGIVTNLRRRRWKWLLLPGFLLAQAWATWRLVVRFRPDVVHAHWLVPQGLVMALLGVFDRRIPPFVMTSHGADLFALRSPPMRWLKRFVVKRAAAVTVVSTAMKAPVLQLGADPGKVSVEPMGVDLSGRFRPDPDAVPEPGRLLFVGRLVEKKGLRHMLAALAVIRARYPDTRLAIVGFGPEEPALRRQVEVLGLATQVDFLGAVPQDRLPSLYQWASVFVAPFVEAAGGDQEGLGLVVVEAAGCGCPVVAGDVPAVHDVVTSPDIGVVVPAHRHEDLAAAVIATLEAGRARDDDRRRAQAVAHFDWDARARSYGAILRATMERR